MKTSTINILIAIAGLLLIGGVVYFILKRRNEAAVAAAQAEASKPNTVVKDEYGTIRVFDTQGALLTVNGKAPEQKVAEFVASAQETAGSSVVPWDRFTQRKSK